MALDQETRSDLKEVLYYAIQAQDKLRAAEKQLKYARVGGVIDVGGGKLVTSAVKHHFMNKAQSLIAEAQNSLQIMNTNLEDVSGLDGVKLDTFGFAGLTDLLLDNFASDLYMLGRINKSLKQVQEAERILDGIIEDLRAALRA